MVILVRKRHREYIDLRCRSCQASCTFVITKLRFVLPKVTCRLLRIGAIISLFRPAKCFRETNKQVYQSMTRQRTKVFQLRLTPEEAVSLKRLSKDYHSVAYYIRSAVAEYSNVNAKQKLELIQELGTFYRKFQYELSHIGGNLNQSVKRINELSVAGLLSPSYIKEVLMPSILETQRTLNGLKKELDAVTKRAVKL